MRGLCCGLGATLMILMVVAMMIATAAMMIASVMPGTEGRARGVSSKKCVGGWVGRLSKDQYQLV